MSFRPDAYDRMAGMEKGRSESVNLNRNLSAKSVWSCCALLCSC